MAFNPWTFSLEVLNFLVLVVILWRILYKPIVEIINSRREHIRQQMGEAAARRSEAESLKAAYERQLSEASQERNEIMAQARREAEEQGRRILAEAQEKARREAERVLRAAEEEKGEVLRQMEEEIIGQAVGLAGRLTTELAAASLHEALVAKAVQSLAELEPGQARRALASARDSKVIVTSNEPLTSAQRKQVLEGVERLLRGVEVDFRQDGGMGAGLRIELGELVLEATLSRQLERLRKEAASRVGEDK